MMSNYHAVKVSLFLIFSLLILSAFQIDPGTAITAQNQPDEILGFLQSDPNVIYGPTDGWMILNPDQVTYFEPKVQISDFIAEVTYYNPYGVEKNAWSYGIAFRGNSGRWMLLSVSSQSTWKLMCGINGQYSYPNSGNLTNLDLNPTGSNRIEVRAKGTQGELYINYDFIGAMDLSCTSGPGDVSLYAGKGITGDVTKFSGFTIKKNEVSPRTVGNETQPRDFKISTDDTDMDGLDDQFEKGIMRLFKPKLIYDEEEHNLLLDQDPRYFDQFYGVIYLHQVSMASCKLDNAGNPVYASFSNLDVSPRPKTVLLTMLAIYPYDYIPWKNTIYVYKAGEEDILAHNGDIEPMKICIGKVAGTEGEYKIDFIHLRRHKDDHIYTLDELEKEFDGTINHPIFYVSEGKHAAYGSADECENAAPWYEVPGWDEDCDGGKAIWPSEDFSYNVGEYYPEKSLTLSDYGLADHLKETAAYDGTQYVDEYVWTPFFRDDTNRQAYFCGGFNVLNYYDDHHVKTFYFEINCPGGINGKWWIRQTEPSSGIAAKACFEQDTDRYGSDYAYFDMSNPNPEECKQACLNDPACVSFTYLSPGLQTTTARCYLKNAAATPSQMVGAISGLKANCQK